MHFIIYKTQNFTNQINKDNNIKNAIDRFEAKLKNCNDINSVRQKLNTRKENILSSKIWKKRILDFRLIVEEKEYDEGTAFIFRLIFKRDDPSYKDFLNNRNLPHIPLNEEKTIKNLLNTPIPSLPPDNPSLSDPPDLNFNINIFESNEWVKNKIPQFNNYWYNYLNILKNIFESQDSIKIQQINNDFLYNVYLASDNENRRHIVYKEFSIYNNLNQKNERCIFLIKCLYGYMNQEMLVLLLNELHRNYGNSLAEFEPELIIKNARRAYPDYLLADDDLWKSLQDNHLNNYDYDRSNLVLSGEELNLLKNFEFPLFISGRAGSGKSTMLLYAFAGYAHKFINFKNNDKKTKPIFLTYSEKLLETSKEVLTELLLHNPHFAIDIRSAEQIKSKLDELMFTFTNFLKEKIFINKNLSELFPDEKHLTYSLFKKIYTNSSSIKNTKWKKYAYHGRIKHDPTLVWHTIRAIIKNDITKNIITPDEFEKLENKRKNILLEDFRDIYDNIFERWYKLRVVTDISKINETPIDNFKDMLWDDMDLISYVYTLIDSEEEYHKYSVIFCDEAQDFTKKEFILLLNIILDNKTRIKKGNDLPFAFAGDELQTINPTGFRWGELTASFYNAIQNLNNEIELKLKPIELNKNYRSNKCIVHLANLIQLFREYFINKNCLNSFKFQECWNDANNFKNNIVFEKDFNINELKDYLKDNEFVIILPIEEGEEEEFLRNDSIFDEVDFSEEDKFYTISQVKGLEFSNVIVYKYGEYARNHLPKLFLQEINNDDEKLKASYFLNKLYVAITRAKESVFVFESDPNEETLWKHFIEKSSSLENFGFRRDEYARITDNIQFGYLTRSLNITELKPLNSRDIAIELERKGINLNDTDLLKRAANYYRKVGDINKALNCEAQSFEIDNEYEIAGDIWFQLNRKDNAAQNYWKAENWLKLKKVCKKDSIQNIIANFMLDVEINTPQIIEVFNYNTLTFLSKQFDKTSIHLLQEIFSRINKIKDFTVDEIERINDTFSFLLKNYGYLIPNSKIEYTRIMSLFNFKAKKYSQTINLLEEIGDTKNETYYWAKYFVSKDIFEKLSALRNIEYGRIVSDIIVQNEIKLLTNKLADKNEIRLTGNYFYKYNHINDALSYWDRIPDLMESDETYLSLKARIARENNLKIEYLNWLIKLIELQSKEHYIKEFFKLIDNLRLNRHQHEFYELTKSNLRFKVIRLLFNLFSSTQKNKLKFNEEEYYFFIFNLVKEFNSPIDWVLYFELIDNFNFSNDFEVWIKLFQNICNMKISKSEFKALCEVESQDNILKLINKSYNEIISCTYIIDSNEKISYKLFFVLFAFERLFSIFKDEFLIQLKVNIYDLLENLTKVYQRIIKETTNNTIINNAKGRWLAINKQKIKELDQDKYLSPEKKQEEIEKVYTFIKENSTILEIDSSINFPLFDEKLEDILIEIKSNFDDTELNNLITWCIEENLIQRKNYLLKDIINKLKELEKTEQLDYIDLLEKFLFEMN